MILDYFKNSKDTWLILLQNLMGSKFDILECAHQTSEHHTPEKCYRI